MGVSNDIYMFIGYGLHPPAPQAEARGQGFVCSWPRASACGFWASIIHLASCPHADILGL